MSEHEWAQENIAGYSAGGLESTERDRLEKHIANCDDCRRALEDLRDLDRKIGSLFATARPSATLEDRVVQSIRNTSARRRWRRPHWILTAAAAAILLGCVGALADLAIRENFPLPPYVQYLRTGEWALTKTQRQESLKDASQLAKEVRDGYDAASLERAARLGKDLGINYYDSTRRNPSDDQTLDEAKKRYEAQLGLPVRSGRIGGKRQDRVRGEGGGGGRLGVTEPSAGERAEMIIAGNEVTTENAIRRQNPVLQSPRSLAEITSETEKLTRLGKDDKAGAKSEPRLVPQDPAQRVDTLGRVGKTQTESKPPTEQAAQPSRKIIRSGEIEFEVQSFDSSVAAITKLIDAIKGGFIATTNSEKLPNGKVRGSVVVRVPPETLDALILDLRKELGKLGELKGMKIGSQDITKQYTDLESHLRGARAMQERLLQMIKDGKGAIKDLLAAEKELGVWRTKIEELEGEVRYYNNQVALSTLTISLTEKDIRSPFALVETQRVLVGLEVEDVEKAYQQVLTAVAQAKGRITKSELKQTSPERFGAVVNFEVAPESAGPLRDRLVQLGNVARLEVDRVQQTEGGTGRPQDGKTKQNDTQFFVSLYNLSNFSPRETATVQIAALDVAVAYRALQEAVAKIKGRVITSQLNEQDKQNITAQLDFDLHRADEPSINTTLGKIGDLFSRNVARTQDNENVLDSKVRFLVGIISQSRIPPRETTVLGIEVTNVDATAGLLSARVADAKGRTVESNVAHERDGRVTAKLVYDVPLPAATGLLDKFNTVGVVRVQKSSRNEQVPDGPLAIARIDLTLSNTELIVPSDQGIWPQVRRGLSTSVTALSWSLTVVIIGVCFVLPWAAVIYTGYRVARRVRRAPTN
jgi:hypothetical protein